jgi:hypothetical protein
MQEFDGAREQDKSIILASANKVMSHEFDLLDRIDGRLQEYLVGKNGRKISISV